MKNLKLISTLLLTLMLSANLFAGGVIKIKSVMTDSGEISKNIIYVQDGKIRVESNDDGEKSIVIIDQQKGVMIMIDPSDESYMILTEKDFNRFIDQIKLQKEKMLAQLPEEQREAMSKMFDQQMQQRKNEPKIEYKKIGNESFNGYDCEVYHGFKLDEKIDETWIASWEDMKLKDEYVKVFKGMEKFFQKMADSMGEYGQMMESDFDSEMFDKGFPVKTIEYEDGSPVSTETIEEVEEKDIPSSLFEAPKNMTKKDAFEM